MQEKIVQPSQKRDVMFLFFYILDFDSKSVTIRIFFMRTTIYLIIWTKK
jgi:hypothetical protein